MSFVFIMLSLLIDCQTHDPRQGDYMISHEVQIPYSYGETIRLKPIYDTHIGNSRADVKLLQQYLSDHDDRTYYFLGGDILDSIITKDAKRYAKSADATLGDAIIDEQVDAATDILNPVRDNIIGSILGNHETKIIKDCSTNPGKRVARNLGVKYLGIQTVLRMKLHMIRK